MGSLGPSYAPNGTAKGNSPAAFLEPIAIVGMSCRLPGGADSPEKLWQLLKEGRSAWEKTPKGRFNQEGFHDPSPDFKAGTTNTDGGHFLQGDIKAFDAAFFGIHPLEATAMDPQQRLILETAYQAFENAGLSLEQLSGSNTGVYVGLWASDYQEILTRDHDYTPTYQVTGTGTAIASNRVSYCFNLKGPSLTLDTGCSASLVAVHQAVQSLRAGESETCFVAGVNLLLDPQRYAYQSRLKMFSRHGKSYSFDHRALEAVGYGRGEGCSGVVLMPLSLARKREFTVRGIIRNSVINQDGKTHGISFPSAEAQAAAMGKAYAQVGLPPYADYVEAHGTGTKAGDPIEAKAIAKVLGGKTRDTPLPIGSVKASIGHLESAAGISGLIKAVLMLENGMIPPQANFEKPNPEIEMEELNLRVPTELEQTTVQRISVNSFGYGGTNAHVIVDSAGTTTEQPRGGSGLLANDSLALQTKQDVNSDKAARLFVLSAANEKSCQEMASAIAGYLTSKPDTADTDALLNSLAYTLSNRSSLERRLGIIASTKDDLITQLSKLSTQSVPRTDRQAPPRIAFVFGGQGAQYPKMAHALLGSWPYFAASMGRANRCIKKCGASWDLFGELAKEAGESRMEEPCIAQPITTAVQISLVDALRELGIEPVAVTGHSSGEISAAYCCGGISFEDAMQISYHRGRLTSELRAETGGASGAMMAVAAPERDVQKAIELLGQDALRVVIACHNSPSSVTVSGDEDVVYKLKQHLDSQEIWNRILRTGGAAYHSPQMMQIACKYSDSLNGLSCSTATSKISMISSVTGEELNDQPIYKSYWVENLVSPVRFTDALKKTCTAKDGTPKVDLILEIGSHTQLEGPIKETLKSLKGDASNIHYTGTLKRGTDARLSMLAMLRSLYLHKATSAFWKVNAGFLKAPARLTDLPPYQFDHSKTFWHESRVSIAYRNRQHLPHEILGNPVHDNNPLEPRWRCFLNVKDVPWLSGHVIQGQIVFPGTGYLAMALQAARQDTHFRDPGAEIERFVLRNVTISQALVLDANKSDLEISLSLRPQAVSARKSSKVWQEFRIFSTSTDDVWTEHCRGLLQVILSSDTTESHYERTRVTLGTHSQRVQGRKLYYRANDLGLQYGPPFDNLKDITTMDGASVSDASFVATGCSSSRYTIHPAVLDSTLYHAMMSILIFEDNITSPVVPTFIEKLIIAEQDPAHPVEEVTCHTRRTKSFLTFDIGVHEKDKPDNTVLQAWGVCATKLPSLSLGDKTTSDLCHVIDWVTYMPRTTTKHITQLCKSAIRDNSPAEDKESLTALALHYIQRALACTPIEEIPQGFKRHWYNWMQTLPTDAPSPPFLRTAEADTGITAETLRCLGPHLAGLLRGTVHPLSLLTGENLLGRMYSEERCARCIDQISAYCGALGAVNPGMKVLEIGAGTGSATLPILKALTGRSGRVMASEYDFTDISPGFFPAARTLLAEYDGVVNFKTLDVEQGPEANGFHPHSYDVVIACNVIHATSRIDAVLANARALLRPGGKFILMELTEDRVYYNLVFGAFSGWWAGYEEGRTMSPLLSRGEWMRRLEGAGFARNEAVAEDYPVGEGGTITVFVAESEVKKSLMQPLDVDIVTLDQALHSSLVTQFQRVLEDRKVDVCAPSSPVTGDKMSIILPDLYDQLAWDFDDSLFELLKARIIASRAVLFVIQTAKSPQDRNAGDWVYGFCRSIRQEYTSVRFITLEIESQLSDCLEQFQTILQSSTGDLSLLNGEVELEFLEKEGQLFIPRVNPEPSLERHINLDLARSAPQEAPFMNNRPMSAELGISGVLDTIRWVDNPAISGPLDPDYVKLQLCAASINFKDVLIASGQLEGITHMQNDCAGIVLEVGENMKDRFKPGDRVCAMKSQSYTNYPVVHGDWCHLVPSSMDIIDAASIPLVWSTVYHSLVNCGKLKQGESILIHSAAGAVGQAAIMLAQHIGADIYATCSNDSKVDLLVREFNIPCAHILSSRSTSFRAHIHTLTGGRGVDVVLNSLGGEMFRESCACLAPFGRFVEIGRKDLMEDALMPMEFLLRNITFSYVDLAHIIDTRRELAKELLEKVMELFEKGAVQHVRQTRYPISQIGEAFRLIQTGKHTGKVMLVVEQEQKVQVVEPRPRQAELRPDGTYIVVGGLGGLGRPIVNWMAHRGARHIVIFSRSANIDTATQSFLERLSALGVTVQVRKCDITCKDSLNTTLASITESLPPIRGIIQAAMVLHDILLDDMTPHHWHKALAPKVQGSWNLHSLLPHNLDFFIMLSSVVSMVGNVGSSNYSAACSYQDGLARYRRRIGLAAHSINVGAVVEAGYVSENPDVAETLRRVGLGNVSIADFLSHLGHIISSDGTPYAQSSIGLVPSGDRGLDSVYWTNDRKFVHLGRESQASGTTSSVSDDVGTLLQKADTYAEALGVVRTAMVRQLGTMLAMGADEIISARGLDSYGVDSLVAVELRNWIGAYLQVNLPLLVMWSAGSIDELAGIVTKGSRLVGEKVRAEIEREK